jgi:hypothetical protein
LKEGNRVKTEEFACCGVGKRMHAHLSVLPIEWRSNVGPAGPNAFDKGKE